MSTRMHVLCPFYRLPLAPTLAHYLEPMGVDFYPIMVGKEHFSVERTWIHPVNIKEKLLTNFPPYEKINDFFDTQEVFDEDYYGFLGDDDMYEPTFCAAIKEQTAGIIFVSGFRGDSTPRDGTAPHPPTTLRPICFSDVKVCRIGFPMYIMKGRIAKQMRFKLKRPTDDGDYAVELKDRWPNEVKFMPDLFVLCNYFQRGRFTIREKLLKADWDLPKFIKS